MSGVVGVVSHGRGPLPAGELRRLVDAYGALRGAPAATIRTRAAGAWAEVAVIDGDVPGEVAVAGDAWLVAAGAVHADVPLAQSRAEDLDGQFAAVAYDPGEDVLAVLCDPFGMQALHVAERDGLTYVSTSAAVLARHLGAPADPLGSKVFLRAGYLFGPVTHWEGVRRLGPAERLSFTPSGLRRDVYFRPQVDPQVRGLSLRRTADLCVEVALDVAARRLARPERIWADLTGGFDSRLVVGLLTDVGAQVMTSTNGGSRHPDVVLARQVAQAGGYTWRHEREPEGWQMPPELADAAVAWGDGALELFQLAEVLAGHQRKSVESRVVVTGGGGEHVSARPWVHELWRAGRTQAVDFEALLRMRYLHPIDLSVLREDPSEEVEAYFRHELGARAALYDGELNTTKLDAVYAYKSTGHFGAYRSASEAVVRQEMPFYLRDFFGVCFSAHHRWRDHHRLQRAIIERLNPVTAAVPTTLGGPAEPLRLRNAHRFVPYYTGAVRATANKVRERIRPPAPRPPDPAVTARRARVVAELRARGALDPAELRSAPLYDEAALTRLVSGAGAPGFRAWQLLGRVATLELALRAGAPAAAPQPAAAD